jgi:hypothetical protein
MGFRRLLVRNLFAYVATVMDDMLRHPEPVGPDNDRHILDGARQADKIICAWGSKGDHLGRATHVTAMLRSAGHELWCLRLTPKSNQPEHPLYVGYNVQPRPYTP